jgi:hypothetical protein
VKTWFQASAFKCNLHRYTMVWGFEMWYTNWQDSKAGAAEVGL